MADAESVSLKHEVPVLIAATLIVASGVCVEKAQRWLLRWVSPNTVPVVHALFREVSLLGVVALMFFVADRSGLLRNLSLYHFGDPDEMGKLAQSVDLVRCARGATAPVCRTTRRPAPASSLLRSRTFHPPLPSMGPSGATTWHVGPWRVAGTAGGCGDGAVYTPTRAPLYCCKHAL